MTTRRELTLTREQTQREPAESAPSRRSALSLLTGAIAHCDQRAREWWMPDTEDYAEARRLLMPLLIDLRAEAEARRRAEGRPLPPITTEQWAARGIVDYAPGRGGR